MGMAAFTVQGANVKANLPTMIGLGRLVELIVRGAQSQRLRITPQDEWWLAWKSDTRDLVALRPERGVDALAKSGDVQRHQAFHGAVPKKARAMEWPQRRGVVRTLGLIESVTYSAIGILSPSKGTHRWIHQFGDRGERGHGPMRARNPDSYAERFMPLLEIDRGGNLFVVRRPGNRYAVNDWIIG